MQTPQKVCRSAFDVSLNQSVSVASNALAKTNPWLTPRQLVENGVHVLNFNGFLGSVERDVKKRRNSKTEPMRAESFSDSELD